MSPTKYMLFSNKLVQSDLTRRNVARITLAARVDLSRFRARRWTPYRRDTGIYARGQAAHVLMGVGTVARVCSAKSAHNDVFK